MEGLHRHLAHRVICDLGENRVADLRKALHHDAGKTVGHDQSDGQGDGQGRGIIGQAVHRRPQEEWHRHGGELGKD